MNPDPSTGHQITYEGGPDLDLGGVSALLEVEMVFHVVFKA